MTGMKTKGLEEEDWNDRDEWRRKKKGGPKKTWMEGVQEAMTVGGLETDQWMDREEWRLVSGRQRKMS